MSGAHNDQHEPSSERGLPASPEQPAHSPIARRASSNSAISVEGVGKRYTKLEEQAMLLRSVLPLARPARSDLWALRDIDLTIAQGETVGIIGRNGAGKTTLLRLIAGVTRPTTGRVEVNGRIAPLISVGVGFHREMSGRENVYVNGMMLGLTREQLDERFDEIVAFAELEEFIDTPVKFYSSGMFLRLGFSVAIHVEPEVLLVDEILAVGDVGFQLKCHQRMQQVQARGTTIVIVSHSMHAIRALCPRAILMRDGGIEFDGESAEAIARQHQLLSAGSREPSRADDAPFDSAVRIVDRRLEGPDGRPTHQLGPDEPAVYRATLQFAEAVVAPDLLFQVFTLTGTLAYEIRTVSGDWRRFEPDETAVVEIPFEGRLGGGTYRLVLNVLDRNHRDHLYEDVEGLVIYVGPRPGIVGIVDLRAEVAVDGEPLGEFPDLLLAGDAEAELEEIDEEAVAPALRLGPDHGEHRGRGSRDRD